MPKKNINTSYGANNITVTNDVVLGSIGNQLGEYSGLLDVCDKSFKDDFYRDGHAKGGIAHVGMMTYPLPQYGKNVSVSPKSAKVFPLEIDPATGIINFVHSTDILAKDLYYDRANKTSGSVSATSFSKNVVEPTALSMTAAISRFYANVIKKRAFQTLVPQYDTGPESTSPTTSEQAVAYQGWRNLSHHVFTAVSSFNDVTKINQKMVCIAYPEHFHRLKSALVDDKLFTPALNDSFMDRGYKHFMGYDLMPSHQLDMHESPVGEAQKANTITSIKFDAAAIKAIDDGLLDEGTLTLTISGSGDSSYDFKMGDILVFKGLNTIDDIEKCNTNQPFTCNVMEDKDFTLTSGSATVEVKVSRVPVYSELDPLKFNENHNVNKDYTLLSGSELEIQVVPNHYKAVFLVDKGALIALPCDLDDMAGIDHVSYNVKDLVARGNSKGNQGNRFKQHANNYDGLKIHAWKDSQILQGETVLRISTFIGGGLLARNLIQVPILAS